MATAFTLTGAPDNWEALPPIGCPVTHAAIQILDRRLRPVPIGVPGELYIGGEILARGYHGRPDLTAERFIPDPFGHRPGARLYKTGDLARWRADGALEYLGRNDFQLKVRGYRIEPGEIEAALSQHPAVRESVVLAAAGKSGAKRLAAYVVSAVTAAELVPSLRSFLAARLPDYMIPERFRILDQLPLTPSGKLDRRALTVLELSGRESLAEFVPPRDGVELQLAQLWQELLEVYPVSRRDNFFELGGHSLLAVRLMARLQTWAGRELPLTLLFQHPTLEQLAAALRPETPVTPFSPLVALRPTGSKRPFFCVHPGGGQVLSYIQLAQHLESDRPFYGLQSVGLSNAEPQDDIETMAAGYLAAIRAVQPDGPYLLGGWSMGGLVAFEMAQQLHAQGQTVATLILIDTQLPSPDEQTIDSAIVLAAFAQDLGIPFNDRPQALTDPDPLSLGQRLAQLIQEAKQADKIPPDLPQQYIEQLYKVFQANYRAMLAYRPQPYSGRVVLLRADEGQEQINFDSTLGWHERVHGKFVAQLVPGNHFSLMRAPQVQALGQQIQIALKDAPGDRL